MVFLDCGIHFLDQSVATTKIKLCKFLYEHFSPISPMMSSWQGRKQVRWQLDQKKWKEKKFWDLNYSYKLYHTKLRGGGGGCFIKQCSGKPQWLWMECNDFAYLVVYEDEEGKGAVMPFIKYISRFGSSAVQLLLLHHNTALPCYATWHGINKHL